MGRRGSGEGGGGGGAGGERTNSLSKTWTIVVSWLVSQNQHTVWEISDGRGHRVRQSNSRPLCVVMVIDNTGSEDRCVL